jgi:4-diphosphocytidyl-2-C-methyl-D-erythritol kinase
VRIRAPAKINLWLRVLGELPDGYHLVDTLIVPVTLYDEIRIARRTSPGLEVVCDDPRVPSGPANLAYRAAAKLLRRAGRREPIRIRIRKRIPVGAGLGGGSSDAAAALLGLNRILGLNLPRRELAKIGAEIGADVPFFVYGRPARVRGKGERITALRSFPRLWVVIVYPGFAVSTAWAYRRLKLDLTKGAGNTSITVSLRSLRRKSGLGGVLVNDLEAVTVRRYPEIGRYKERLMAAGAQGALMSGSGSSVFGVFASKRAAQRAFQSLRKEGKAQVYLVRSLS